MLPQPKAAISFSSISETSNSIKVQLEIETPRPNNNCQQLVEDESHGHLNSHQGAIPVDQLSSSISPTLQNKPSSGPTNSIERTNTLSSHSTFVIGPDESILLDMDAKFAEIHPGDIVPDLEFNLSQLLSIAAATMNSPCTNLELLGFGLYNKAYLLAFTNGKEAVARLPYNMLRTQYRLQSEVGAMKYAAAKLPEKWKRLVPRIYTWDSDPQNPVGTPYMIMEKMKGTTLAKQDSNLTYESKEDIAVQLAQFTSAMHQLGSEFGNLIGGVYCDGDGFKIGPLIRNWPNDARQGPDMDNGPWQSTPEFMRGQFRQILSTRQKHYLPQANSKGCRHGTKVKDIIDFILDACSLVNKLDPKAITGDPDADTRRAFVHTDLHADNILIDPESATLSGIIDWEAAGILPEPFAVRVPSWLDCPDVYSPVSPLSTLDERYRDWFHELTRLRQRYCLERGYLEGPDYRRALNCYDDLHKLDKCAGSNLFDFENLELRKWVAEKIKPRHMQIAG